MSDSRSQVISSFTIIKGSLIEETFSIFREWDFELSKIENLNRMKESNSIGASSSHWLRDVSKVINRRFDPNGGDRPLVDLAKVDCDQEIWKPLLLWHMTRDEYLVRNFFSEYLFEEFRAGAYKIHTSNVLEYLDGIQKRADVSWSGSWSNSTKSRVASGLLRIATDFGILIGTKSKEFRSYHLPEQSFLYLLHVMAETESNARRIIDSHDWRMFLMDVSDIERELLRLHQFHKVHYQTAGSLAQLKLPCDSPEAYVKEQFV